MKIIDIKRNILYTIIISLLCLGILLCLYFHNTLSFEEPIKGSTKVITSIENSDMFAILLETDEGIYVESTATTWPTNGYVFDESRSGCVDIYGNNVAGILSFNNNIATVNTSKTVQCYLYFNINS